jgi:hypothetical protein
MIKMVIELLRYDKEGATCCRCTDSSEAIKQAIHDLKGGLESVGVRIEFKEVLLNEDRIHLSNTVLINGKDIIETLGEKQPVMTPCPSCSELTGKETDCKSFMYKGNQYNSITKSMLVEAIMKEATPILLRSQGSGSQPICSCYSKKG